MPILGKNTTGLALGVFFALAHLAWAVVVAAGAAKTFLDWVLHLHFMEWSYTMAPFSALTALWLVIMTFVAGYVFGWVFAWVWNLFHKQA